MSDIDELRRLLLGEERESLNELRQRVENPGVRAQDIAEVLPESIRLGTKHDGQLLDSLRRPVDECIRQSVRRDPDSFADALFPVMGPAIRKSVLELFRSLTQRLNQTIEHALSWRGIKWRWEAWRSGLSIGDVILRHTLVYRVDQLFAIHANSGLLLEHVAHIDPVINDSDAVSAMLTAIQDFVRDSFGETGQSDLDTIDIGEHTVWIMYGPDVMLAVVFRGVPPLSLRNEFRNLLDEIHVKYGEEIAGFEGQSNALAGARELMEAYLFEQTVDQDRGGRDRSGLSLQFIIVLVWIALLAGAFVASRVFEHRRIRALEDALAREAGIVVLDIAQKEGKIVFEGLKDPLARAPEDVVREAGFSEDDVAFEFSPFYSLDEALVLTRARNVLGPPSTVELTLRDGALFVSGTAPVEWVESLTDLPAAAVGMERFDSSGLRVDTASLLARVREQISAPDAVELALDGNTIHLSGTASWSWIEDTRLNSVLFHDRYVLDLNAVTPSVESLLEIARDRLDPPQNVSLQLETDTLIIEGTAPAAWIGGLPSSIEGLPAVGKIDHDGLRSEEALELNRAVATVDGTRLLFTSGVELAPESEQTLVETIRRIKQIVALAGEFGTNIAIDVSGYTDSVGQDSSNRSLRLERAEFIAARLDTAGIDRARVRALAADTGDSGETPDYRRAEIRVKITGTGSD